MKKTTIIIVLLGLIQPVFSQKKDSIPELVVTENRNAIQGTNSNRLLIQIDESYIKNSPTLTLTELLENTAGVDIRSRGAFGTQADIQIKGGTFEQTLILINGIKFTDPQTGHHLMNIPLAQTDIERIEILKGAAARVFGQNAYAGVVNIITKKSSEKELGIGWVMGQNGLQRQSVNLSLPIGQYQQRISFEHLASDGYRSNTDFKIYQGFYQGNWDIKNHQFGIFSGLQSKKMGANSFYTSAFPWQYEETKMGAGAIQYKNTTWLNLKSNLSYRQHDDMFELKRDTPSFSQNNHLTHTWAWDASVGENNFLGNWNAGMEIRRENITSSNLGDHQRYIPNLFFEQQIHWQEKWLIVPGICLSNYPIQGWVAYPGLDLGYHHPLFSVSAQVGKTFRMPSYTELYYKDAGKSSIGNPNLLPEHAITYELNIKSGSLYGITANTGVFLRDGVNQIDWIKDSVNAPSWKAVNQGRIVTKGFECNVNYKPQAQNARNPLLNINAGYSYIILDRYAEAGTSRYVFDYLRNQFTGDLNFRIYKSLQATMRMRYEERVGYTSYWLFDAKISYTKPFYAIFIEGSNLTDVSYYEVGKVVMPGRWLRAGINLQTRL